MNLYASFFSNNYKYFQVNYNDYEQIIFYIHDDLHDDLSLTLKIKNIINTFQFIFHTQYHFGNLIQYSTNRVVIW